MDIIDNIKLAKEHMVESVYRSANIEGIEVTFSETKSLCAGLSVSGHTRDEISAVIDLKKAWEWLLDNIGSEISVDTLCQLNRKIGYYTVINAGSIRDEYDEAIRVSIGDDKYYYPPIPLPREEIDKYIKKIVSKKDLNGALELFSLICKMQMFNDGNKRTATLIANLHMIQTGSGILSIPVKYKKQFYHVLTSYYEDDSYIDNLKEFLMDYCITGISD